MIRGYLQKMVNKEELPMREVQGLRGKESQCGLLKMPFQKKSIKTTRGNPIREKINAKRRQTLSNVRRHSIKKRNSYLLKAMI